MLRVGQECTVGAYRARQHHARVLGHLVGDHRRVERLLTRFHPGHQPAQIADGQRVVVLDTKSTGIVQRAVANVGHDRQAQPRRHGNGFERVEPADA